MKKIIALLLLAVICLSLVACGNKAEKEIVGEWKCADFGGSGERLFIFNKDGTGNTTIFYGGTESGLRWKYDEDLSVYTIAFDNGETLNTTIKTDEGGRYIYVVVGKFYFVEE